MEAQAAERGTGETPIRVDVAMFGGPRAGKTSLLASMYRGVRGQVRQVGLGIRRRNQQTIDFLEAGTRALERLPEIVTEDPTLMGHRDAVPPTPAGTIRRFDFVLHGAGVDVAMLSFYDFSGEDIRDHAPRVSEALREADILFVAINTPAMMEAYASPDYDQLHLDWNLVDHFDLLLESWSGPPPALVMFCPIKSERWLQSPADAELLQRAVADMYSQSFALLQRPAFEGTTVIVAPVETVGTVSYRGLDRYNPANPPTAKNVVFSFQSSGNGGGEWNPRYHEQPFRWALLGVTRAVDYGAIHRGRGGGFIQKGLAWLGEKYEDTGLPKIKFVEEFWDNQTGLEKFQIATAELAEGRLLESPFHLVHKGVLMEPVKR